MVSELERIIEYEFKDKSLLKQSMLHRSAANELNLKRIDSNERLEFLGDAVLELISSIYLFNNNKDLSEGKLTKIRASQVCEKALSHLALDMGLEKFITIGKGEEKSGGRNKPSITSDALEALIGAIYLDGGYAEANKFIHKFVLDKQENMIFFNDSKSQLQEFVQKQKNKDVTYKVVSESGPDHNKVYEIVCIVNDKQIAIGHGHTKKEAEQDAARKSLEKFEIGSKTCI